MLLKELFNRCYYCSVGYVSKKEDLDILESYIQYNMSILNEFKNIITSTTYSNLDEELKLLLEQTWKKYFPNSIHIDAKISRTHSFGAADNDNNVFDYCKINNIEWMCKSANDVILDPSLLNLDVNESDFYYLNGISYEDITKSNFSYDKLYNEHFYPQTNFYIINVAKCDYLNDKKYINDTFKIMTQISNYSGKIWEYIPGWSCENFLKQCVERNNLKKYYLLNKDKHNQLCEVINQFKIGDPSHKNIMINGICHFQFPEQQIIEI